MKITQEKLIDIIKEEVIRESGGVAGNFGGKTGGLGAVAGRAPEGPDSPDHSMYGPEQTAEDNFVGILNDLGHMLDAWEQKKYLSDEDRYESYFEYLQGLLEQYDPCAHVGQKCEESHPNQSHEECVEVTINDALYEAAQKLDEIPTWRKIQYQRDGTLHPGLSPQRRGPVSPERKLEHGEKCPSGYELGLTDYCEKIGANPMEIDSAISRIEGKQSGGYGGLEEKENNPWAICTDSVGREDKDKYESCVKSVKKQNKKK